jgi:hypothetical protein
VLGLLFVGGLYAVAPASGAATAAPLAGFALNPNAAGGLDCNGYSPMQTTIQSPRACTDIRGSTTPTPNTWNGRFYDNGHYIGHDEPDMTFFSTRPGSGNTVNWTETLPKDPTALPTVATPGSDITHFFELSVAPWFGMALCDGNSYPQLPCSPQSDINAPACFGPRCPQNAYPGAGSAFLEMQFYPPGQGPFVDNPSCNNTQWCASLHINEAECTFGFVSCNPNCSETTNFAFVQRDGVPTGPPSPQLMNLASSTPNSETLLMNPGDKLQIRMFDAAAPAVPLAGIPPGRALKVTINDLTTHQTGEMQASAANGYAQTDIATCKGRLFNFQPEYSTAKAGNTTPWAAIQADISTEFEIGHFIPCTSLANQVTLTLVPATATTPAVTDQDALTCVGPYEANTDNPLLERSDADCFFQGDTHGTLASDPNEVTGCLDNRTQNGDLDFDGTSYRRDWPTSTAINVSTSKTPSSFAQSMPTSGGHQYAQFLFQTDTALSEANCKPATPTGCTIPPTGSAVDQTGHTSFYPFWSLANNHGVCTIEFGRVTSGVNFFGRDAQYGTAQIASLGYPEFVGPIHQNACIA